MRSISRDERPNTEVVEEHGSCFGACSQDGAIDSQADSIELIRRATAGDDQAFACVVSDYSPTIRDGIRHVLHLNCGHTPNLIVDDIYQEVLIRVWHYWQTTTPDPPRNPRAWFARVAHNTTVDYLRKTNHGPQLVSLDEPGMKNSVEDKSVVAPGELSVRLRQSVQSVLSDRESAAIDSFSCGMTYEEAARDLDCTRRQIRYLVQTALSKLRDDMRPK